MRRWRNRIESGWVLLRDGDADAWEQMAVALNKHDPKVVEIAVNAAFNLPPARAFELVAPLLAPTQRDESSCRSRAILETIEKRLRGGSYLGNVLHGPRVHAVECVDLRWGDVLRSLASDAYLIEYARRIYDLMAPRARAS